MKRRREEAPMPSTMAGLLRFYEEESFGVKIKPQAVIVAVVVVILIISLAPFFLSL
jgi:preprotein translocase subunit Sec61beta